jgi:hypothetical protein
MLRKYWHSRILSANALDLAIARTEHNRSLKIQWSFVFAQAKWADFVLLCWFGCINFDSNCSAQKSALCWMPRLPIQRNKVF